MSRMSAVVRFSDGAVKHALYDGTNDFLLPRLFDTNDAAWDAYQAETGWGEAFYPEGDPGPGEPVQVYTSYGDGCVWNASATRAFVVDGLAPSLEDDGPDGYADCNWEPPEWARAALGIEPEEGTR